MSGSMVEKKANVTEAECMRRIAVEAGVDPSLIVLEEVSWNTFSNAFCTKKLLLQLITDRSSKPSHLHARTHARTHGSKR
jgi:uncharacterized SAM-binding protein YcdF (DUF218 family)